MWKKGSSSQVTQWITFLRLVIALLRESYSREIRSKNKSVFEKRRDRNIVELHAPTHRLLTVPSSEILYITSRGSRQV